MDKPQKTELEQLNFLACCSMKFADAARILGEVKFYFEIAGKSICLVFAGNKLYTKLIPALEHLKIPETPESDFTICIWDSESSKIEIPEAPCDPYCFTQRGDLKGFNSSRIKIAYQWSENSVSVIDLNTNKAVFWINSYKHLPSSVISAPCHTLLQWWFEKQECQLFPGSVVVTNEGAFLIPRIKSIESSLITTFDLKSDNILQYIEFNYFIIHMIPFTYIINLYADSRINSSNLPEKIPLKAILIPEMHSEVLTTIETISEVNALRKLSFIIMTQIPYSGWQTHQFISELIHNVSPFKLKIGTDINLINNLLSDFTYHFEKYAHQSKVVTHGSKPLISLIIPVFNGDRFIRETVENVVFQKYPHLEIIIVNDGSTDHTEAVIQSIQEKFRYIRQENEGPASARNRGLKEAKGEFIAFLDADDFFPENNLHVLIAEMMQNSKPDVIYGYAQLLQEDPLTGKFECAGNPKESYPYYICSGLYRKSVFDKVGFFDPSLRFSEDTDWFLRAIELNCKIKRIEEVTLFVRRHESNMTKGKDLNELKIPLVLKRKLERLRNKCLK